MLFLIVGAVTIPTLVVVVFAFEPIEPASNNESYRVGPVTNDTEFYTEEDKTGVAEGTTENQSEMSPATKR